jgi:hypothetical protein
LIKNCFVRNWEHNNAVESLTTERDAALEKLRVAEKANQTKLDNLDAIQRHRDNWREYAYGNRDKPMDYLDGNKVDRGQTLIEDLRAQLAQAKIGTAPKMAWRDARPEDAGKGYQAICRDDAFEKWTPEDGARILTSWYPNVRQPWRCTVPASPMPGSCLAWRYCQVLAPVES